MRLPPFLLYFVAFIKADFCNKSCGLIPRFINRTKVLGYPYYPKRPGIIIEKPSIQNKLIDPLQTPNFMKGYKVDDRGFVVLIRVYAPNDPENYETCGGTLINK